MPCDNCEVTCVGSCCAVFPYADPESERFDTLKDAEYLRDMLIPLDLVSAAERLASLGIEPSWVDEAYFDWEGRSIDNPTRRLMTCRHWDTETRLCTAYETRPEMCRNYPYLGSCDYGCSYELTYREKWDYALKTRGPEGGTPYNIERGYN